MRGPARAAPLPRARNRAGQFRRVGIEIEFGGLGEADAAEVVRAALGGSAAESGPHERVVRATSLGDVTVMLDTTYRVRTGKLAQAALDALSGIVPVEVVTAPVAPGRISEVDRLCRRLRAAGALGSRAGMLLGFGLHLNPGVAGETVADLLPMARAYAFLEDHLRAVSPLDTARRVLPFVDPYPRAWLDRLAAPEADDWDVPDFVAAYLETTPSRNRGLDLLPLLCHLAPATVRAADLGGGKLVVPRPAYHFRLPDCRIDEPGWSVAAEWNRWVWIERVAATPGLPEALAAAWREYRAGWTTTRSDWRRVSADIVAGVRP